MIATDHITAALRRLGVRPDDTLFVHAGLQHALRVEGATREAKLATIVRALTDSVADGVLILPTFTYSFCEGEAFDVHGSPSRVGVLTEHFRGLEGVRRTADPIFSCAVRGDLPARWARELYEIGDKDCFGPRSIFAHLVDVGAKLLFLGVGFEACTLVQHAEQRHGVPYRYTKAFSGEVREGATSSEVTARYFVRRLDEGVENFLEPLGAALEEGGRARARALPRGPRLLVVDACAVVDEACRRLDRQPDFLLRRGHAGVPATPGR